MTTTTTTELHDDPRHWDYTNPAQRLLIAERVHRMLDALAFGAPVDESRQLEFAELTNARVHVDRAMIEMRRG